MTKVTSVNQTIRFARAKVNGVKADHVKHEYTLTLKIPFGLREDTQDELARIEQVAALNDNDELVRLAIEPYQTQLRLMPSADSGPGASAPGAESDKGEPGVRSGNHAA